VPSQTELLVYLGLEEAIVGVTKFCVHPKNLRKEKPIVGGTKTVNFQKIKALQPDIILCNKEENTKEIVETLEQEYTVHVSNIFSIKDSIGLIQQYGKIFDKEEKAIALTESIMSEQDSFEKYIHGKPKKKVVYFIWKDPWITVGKNTFIDHMLTINNFENVFSNKTRYPEIANQAISRLGKDDLILLSSEPFPFTEKHIDEIRKINAHSEIKLVDGAYFSWYGSRLLDAFSYFRTLH